MHVGHYCFRQWKLNLQGQEHNIWDSNKVWDTQSVKYKKLHKRGVLVY